ncbi:MAG: Asp-tRNA(Asn)/Glu-tRNA(Gln) amidotransferase subunit GatA [bacterium]
MNDLSMIELRDKIARRELRPSEVVSSYCAAIEKREPSTSAFNEVLKEHAMERAEQMDKKCAGTGPLGELAGVPLAVKDNMCTIFGKTTCSSRILKNFCAPYNAHVIEKLLAHDAIIIGKTNMDEFAMGSSTENSAFAKTKNPWDAERVPGGSSGGSAAAVSARLCAGALGSDTGGSIRQPAAFCGVVGFKPSYGRVSRYGLIAYGSSLDQIGPLTLDVADSALLLKVIAGHDPMDTTSVPFPVPDYPAQVEEPLQNLKIGIPEEFFSDTLDNEVAKALEDAVKLYEDMGAQIIKVSLPHSRIEREANGSLSSYAVACYYIIAMAEASSNLARYDGVHYGHRTHERVGDIIELFSKTRQEGFGDEVKRRIMLGNFTLSSGYYDAYYNKALKVRRLIKNDFDAALRDVDMLLCPVAPHTAFRFGEKSTDALTMYMEDIYTISLNLTGLPGIAIPIRLSTQGLPIGMQLIGKLFKEEDLLRAARMFEKESGIQRLMPRSMDRGEEP